MTTALTRTAPTKEELLQELEVPANQAYLDRIPQEKLTRALKQTSRMRHGMQTVAPLTCVGPAGCPFIHLCPIPERDAYGNIPKLRTNELDYGDLNDYPVGQSCVMESLFIQQKVIDYANHLNVDPANPVEMSIVNELALIDLYKNRGLITLSKGDKNGEGADFLLRDVLVDPETGRENTTTKLHPVVELIDKLEKRREKWLDRLLETRKSKFSMVSKLGNVAENNLVLQELQKLREVIDTRNKTIDVFEIDID